MPFQSDKQRRYLFAEKPDVARKLAEHAKMSQRERVEGAMSFERKHGSGDASEKTMKVIEHLKERPGYYVELQEHLKLASPKRRVDPEAAVYQADIVPTREFHCGNCTHFGGAGSLSGPCPVLGQSVHFFNWCAEHEHEAFAKADGGWETGPRGGIRRRKGDRWQYKRKGSGSSGSGAEEQDAQQQQEQAAGDTGERTPEEHQAKVEQLEEDLQGDNAEEAGKAAIAEVRKKNPQTAEQLAYSLGRKLAARKTEDVDSATKAFLRSYDQTLNPQNIIGHEAGGLLSAEKDVTEQENAKLLAAAEKKVRDRGKKKPEGETNVNASAADADTPKPEKKDDEDTAKSILVETLAALRKAGTQVVAEPQPGATGPKRESALPDFQQIYFQPEEEKDKELEAEQESVRRQASRKGHFFGPPPATTPEPVLRYDTEQDFVQGRRAVTDKEPELGEREPKHRAEEAKPRLEAGAPSKTPGIESSQEGKTHRSPVRYDDQTVDPDARPAPEDDEDEDDEEDDDSQPKGARGRVDDKERG